MSRGKEERERKMGEGVSRISMRGRQGRLCGMRVREFTWNNDREREREEEEEEEEERERERERESTQEPETVEVMTDRNRRDSSGQRGGEEISQMNIPVTLPVKV